MSLSDWFKINSTRSPSFGGTATNPHVRFYDCTLLQPFADFAVGTQFGCITLNTCNVCYFNIPGPQKHYYEPDGTNYIGHYDIEMGDTLFESIFGWNGLFYCIPSATKKFDIGTAMKATSTGFKFHAVTAAEKFKVHPEDTFLTDIKLNLLDGQLSGWRGSKKFEEKIKIKFSNIRNNYFLERFGFLFFTVVDWPSCAGIKYRMCRTDSSGSGGSGSVVMASNFRFLRPPAILSIFSLRASNPIQFYSIS